MKDLRVAWFNPSSFGGFSVMRRVTDVLLQCGRNLESVEGLLAVVPNARWIVIDACKRVKDPESLLELPSLKWLTVNVKNLRHDSQGSPSNSD